MPQFPMNNRMPANFSNPAFQKQNPGMQQPMGGQASQYPMPGYMPQQPFMNQGMQQPMPGYSPQQPMTYTGSSQAAPYMEQMAQGMQLSEQQAAQMQQQQNGQAYPGYYNQQGYGMQPRMGQFNNQQNKMQEQGDRDARRLGGMQDNWAFRNERNIAQGRPALSPLQPARINR